jgi:hypothetical protein
MYIKESNIPLLEVFKTTGDLIFVSDFPVGFDGE